MEKVKKLQDCLIQFLEYYATIKPANMPDIENQIIADTVRNHYQLVRVGWNGDEFVHFCPFHFDIKDGKIWIQKNATDIDIGKDLIDMGIEKTDIVLGFQPPELWQYTGYGVA